LHGVLVLGHELSITTKKITIPTSIAASPSAVYFIHGFDKTTAPIIESIASKDIITMDGIAIIPPDPPSWAHTLRAAFLPWNMAP
jgi:hypothetical protein